MKPRPAPTQAQHMGGHCLTDTALLDLLMAKAPLTQAQLEAFVSYSVQLATGQLVRLPKTVRDHAVAVAKANGLLAKTERKPHPHAGHHNPGDPYSTVPGKVHEAAAKQLGRIPAPIRRAS